MEITAKYFNSLNIDQRSQLVFQNAEYIGGRTFENQKINLWSIDKLFIEVWYLPDGKKINRIELLESLKMLELYIDQN